MARFPTREDCVSGTFFARAPRRHPTTSSRSSRTPTSDLAATAERSWQCAGGLRALGLEQGDPLVTWLPNGKEALLAWFGAAAAGLVYAPLNTGYKGALLEEALNLLRPRVVVAHAGLLERLVGLELGSVERLVVVGDAGDVPSGIPQVVPGRGRPQQARVTARIAEPGRAVGRPHGHVHRRDDRTVEGRAKAYVRT